MYRQVVVYLSIHLAHQRERAMPPLFAKMSSGRRFIFLLTVSTMFLLLTACLNVSELDFTRKRPAVADLTGRWIPIADNIRSVRASGHKVSMKEFNLRPDGTFSVLGLPTPSDLPGASADGLLSGTGVWQISQDETALETWVIILDFASHVRCRVHIQRQRPPYLVHIQLGNPDSGPPLLLQRAS
jgi:hypothetical protein